MGTDQRRGSVERERECSENPQANCVFLQSREEESRLELIQVGLITAHPHAKPVDPWGEGCGGTFSDSQTGASYRSQHVRRRCGVSAGNSNLVAIITESSSSRTAAVWLKGVRRQGGRERDMESEQDAPPESTDLAPRPVN